MGEKVIWDGVIWIILNVGNILIILINDEKEMIDVLVVIFEYLLKEGKIKGILKKDCNDEELEIIKKVSLLEFVKVNEKFVFF